MRKSYGIALALAACAAVALLSCDKDETPFSTQDADKFKSTLAGRVQDQSGNALKGALVTTLPGGATTVTGDSGKFELTLAAGSYHVEVSKDDYRDTSWSDSVRLNILAQKRLDSALHARYRYATVLGTVLDSTGATLNALYAAGVTVANQSVSTQTTAGSFRLGRIEPGSVSLYAVVSGVGYSTLDTVLKPADTLRNVSLRISRKGGTVSGTVLSNSGSVVSGATVSAIGGAISTTTSSTGSFTLNTVPSTGSVVLTVTTPSGDTQKVSGVTATEGSSSSVGKIQLVTTTSGASDSVAARSGFSFGYVGDSVATLLGDTTGRDTSFHIHRWLWSGTGLSDSSDASSYRLHIAKLGWGEGDHSVSVRARALDGRASAAGTVTVRILDTLTALRSLKVGSGSLSPSFDSSVASYVDTVAAATTSLVVAPSVRSSSDTIWVNGAVVASSAGGSVAFSADTVTIPIVVKNAYTPASRTYSLKVVRRAAAAANADTGSFSDPRDSKTYRWVRIGSRKWMAQNLNYDTLNDVGSWCYDDTASYCGTYGRLYTWATAMGLDTSYDNRFWIGSDSANHRGICPSGWRVPTDTEWGTLIAQAGDSARPKLSSAIGWTNGAGSDRLGFNALPSGHRDRYGAWNSLGGEVGFWSATESADYSARYEDFSSTSAVVNRYSYFKSGGYSLRCIEATTPVTKDTSTTLHGLVVGSGTLTPSFDTSVTSYKDTVATGTTQLVLTPTASLASDTIKVNGNVVKSGVPDTVKLNADTATVKIVVSNPNTASTHMYTVGVVRKVDTTYGIPWNDTVSTYGVLDDSRDKQSYRTVKIGTQRWMAQNLNYKADSSWCYDNASDSCLKYGRLYKWAAVMGLNDSCNTKVCSTQVARVQQGICPSGWHVPTDAEWSVLVQYVDSATSGTKLKSTIGWTTNTGTDRYGFRGLPAGYRDSDGSFHSVGAYALFLPATEEDSLEIMSRDLGFNYADLHRYPGNKVRGFSSRCIEGAGTTRSTDTLTTLHSLSITGTLTPTFDTLTKTYADTVSSGTTQLVLTPTASLANDTIKVNGNVVKSGVPDTVKLNADTATVKIVVSNPNTTTVDTYTVNVVRRASTLDTGSFTDSRDGQVYKWTKIGTQTWMAQNLNYKVDSSMCPSNVDGNCATYGRLYQWAAVMGLNAMYDTVSWQGSDSAKRQGVCPSGWHVPTDTEWGSLIAYVGADSARIRLSSTSGWASGNGTDKYGFTVLPAGFCVGVCYDLIGPETSSLDHEAYFWSSSEGDISHARNRTFSYNDAGVYSSSMGSKSVRYSLRCVKGAGTNVSADTLTTLHSLSVGSGTLTPTFDSLRKVYADTVATGTTQLVLTPTASSASDTIRVNGTKVTSGASDTVTLAADTATVRIVVSSPNTATVNTYTVNVVRKTATVSASGWDTTTYGIPWNDTVSTYGTLTDSRDGQTYRTVKIGTQTWMAQNLNYKVDSSWCYDNAADSCLKYGRLYKWATVVGLADSCNTSTCSTQVASVQQGICPSGWHVPSDAEWTKLTDTTLSSSTAETVLKSTSGWTNTGTDLYGFRVLPAGGRNYVGTFNNVGGYAYFWSSSEDDASHAWGRGFCDGVPCETRSYSLKTNGFSSRCLEN